MDKIKIRNFLRNELMIAMIEREKAEKGIVDVILNCGQNDIAVSEYTNTIKYYRNRIAELKKLLEDEDEKH